MTRPTTPVISVSSAVRARSRGSRTEARNQKISAPPAMPAEGGNQQNHRGEETAVRAQQVPYSAKPTKKGGKGESIERGHAAGRMTVPDLRAACGT